MSLNVIGIGDSEKWDRIVRSFENYDICYLSGYAKAFQISTEGEPLLLYFDDGKTRAINVVMKRDIPKSLLPKDEMLFDLSTPYGYGGYWIEGEDFDSVNECHEQFCRDHHIISEFVRFHLLSRYRAHFTGTVETRTRNVIRNLDVPLDVMLLEFEHKVRKNLKRASGVLDVMVDDNGEKLDDFLTIYYGTMDRSGAASDFYFSKQFFQTLNEIKDGTVYVHVFYEGRIISTELVLIGRENCYSFLGGTDSAYFSLRPNDFLKFEIIKWAKSRGLKRFILGGGYGADDGIYNYKKSFAPDGIYDFYIGKKIYDKYSYEELVKQRCKEPDYNKDTAFFPAYRG